MQLFIKIVNSWKPLTIFAKSSILIVDVLLGSEYTSAIETIWIKTKFEHTKEHFISESLLIICQLHNFSLNTTVNLQISVVQKQPFLLLLSLFKGFLMYIQQILCNKILSKKSRWINLKKHITLFRDYKDTRNVWQMMPKFSISGSTWKTFMSDF